MNIGCRIFTKIKRATPELVELFRGMPVANIADNMNRIACADRGLVPLNKTPLLGTAFTVRCPGGDNLMLHKALDMARAGDVIVVDAEGYDNRALCGEIMFTYAMSRGIVGCVIDGAIRDAEAAAELDFPVFARGTQPNGPYKYGPGEIGVPVSVGGMVIFPGDILVGDGDGLVSIRPEHASELANKTHKTMEVEAASFQAIAEGTFNRAWIDQKLTDIGCQIMEQYWDE